MTATSGYLLHNLVLFGRVLRGLGLDLNPGRVVDVVDALGHVPMARKSDFVHALRCLLVRRREDLALFDEAFEVFWRRPSASWTSLDLRALGERRRVRGRGFAPLPFPEPPSRGAGHGDKAASDAPPVFRAILTYSAREVLRHKDFADLSAEEAEQVKAMLGRVAWRIREKRSRRSRAGPGHLRDLRRTVRLSLRYGGEVLEWARREPKTRPRPLVVLADVSGSMERYTRMLLLFVYGLATGAQRRVEAFVFGTRLTRITRQLRGRDVDGSLREVARAVPDWSGGTRIGETVGAFNRHWGRRVLGGGAVVLLISDGWDRGHPGVLRQEMARLQRCCHRLVWLNPLLGSLEYEPLARGMSTALPYVDDFLPVHDVASLEALARQLATLDERGPRRRQQRLEFHSQSVAGMSGGEG